MLAGPSPTASRRSTLPVAGATRSTCAAWSSATHTEPPPIQTLYAALAPNDARRVMRDVFGSMRYSVDAESTAQIAPRPLLTAITGVSRRTDVTSFPVAVFTRTTRDCSLQTTHAVLPSSASVIVGQNGPAAAHAFTVFAPGTEPSAAADAVDASSATAMTTDAIFMVQRVSALAPPAFGQSPTEFGRTPS